MSPPPDPGGTLFNATVSMKCIRTEPRSHAKNQYSISAATHKDVIVFRIIKRIRGSVVGGGGCGGVSLGVLNRATDALLATEDVQS